MFSKKSVIRKRFAKKDYDYNVCQYVKYLFLTIVNNNDSNFFNENIEKKSFLKYYFFDYLGFKKKDIKIVCEILGKEKKEVENIFKLEISEDEKKYFKDALNKNNISCFPYEVRKDREKNDSAIYKFFEKFYDYGDKEFDDQKVWFFYKFQQKVREKIDIRHNLNIIDKTINKIKIEKIKNFFSKFKKYKKNNDVENKLINKDEDNSIIKKKCLKIKKIKKIKIQKNQGNQRKPIQNNLLINEGKDENKKPKKIKIQKIIIQKENNSSKDKLLKNPEKFLKQTIKNRELIRKGKVFKKYFSIFKKKVIPEENKNDENEEEKEDKRPDTFLEAID